MSHPEWIDGGKCAGATVSAAWGSTLLVRLWSCWTRLNGLSAMAKNTGNNSRIGAVLDRFQMLNPATGLYTVFSATTGRILRNKKSPGPAKGIRVRPRNKSGGRF